MKTYIRGSLAVVAALLCVGCGAKEAVAPDAAGEPMIPIIEENEDNGKMLGNDWYSVGDVIDTELLDMQQLASYFTMEEIQEGDEVYQRIYGKSFPTDGSMNLSELRYLKMLYVDYDGLSRCGEMIVNAEIADVTMDIFLQLYEAGYPIERMELIDNYWETDGNTTDRKSILANNSSAFCYRTIAGTNDMSNHAYGFAIDINPHDNPYVWCNPDGTPKLETLDAHEQDMMEQREEKEHAITHEDLAYRLFTEAGFDWGGDWSNPLDYQHFEWKRQ
ncbi:MAG: M15 family metallopeptidase [Lachnospiraceae bacterium]|nr:M15 family metallopeptidase [Lachnospiraceae bacterium]